MKTLVINFILVFLIACSKGNFQCNQRYDIAILELKSSQEFSEYLKQMQIKSAKTLIIKWNWNKADSTLYQQINEANIPKYLSMTVDEVQGKEFKESERYLRKTNFLLERNFTQLVFPDSSVYKNTDGMGIEAGNFRNNGQLESYYLCNSIYGRAYASLPLAVVSDLINLELSSLNPNSVYLSKQGTVTLRFTERGRYFKTYRNLKDFENAQFEKPLLVIVSDNDEEIATTAGARSRAEITADMINQLLVQLDR